MNLPDHVRPASPSGRAPFLYGDVRGEVVRIRASPTVIVTVEWRSPVLLDHPAGESQRPTECLGATTWSSMSPAL